jgi:Cft2 family RNA processing exonuclease
MERDLIPDTIILYAREGKGQRLSSNVTFSLTFLGAAGTVTGSKHLLELDGRRVLTDCGLFQGVKELRERNWAPLPVDPSSIDAVVLTHAHLDHCGYLPRLVAGGYRGRVFCTPATKDLCSLVLPDAAHIQEEDAREANRRGYSKHQPALPLYTSVDAARALDRLQPVGYERAVPLWGSDTGRTGVGPGSDTSPTPVRRGSDTGPTPTVEFINAGHLLGSAYARIRLGDLNIVFGGDLGRYGRPVLPDPSPVTEAAVLLLESTYGDRLHEADDNGERLAAIVRDTAARGGKLIIPSFAIGRVEEVLYWLKRLEEEKRIPSLPVYVDSPMAIGALQFYASRLSELDPELSTGTGPSRSKFDAAATGRRLCDDEDDHGGLAAAIGGPGDLEAAGDCDFVERHGDRRPSAAPSRGDDHQSEKYRPLRRLPGRRHARPPADRRRPRNQTPRAHVPRCRPYRAHRLDVGARGLQRDHAVALRIHPRAAHDVPGPRRSGRPHRPRRPHHERIALARPHRAESGTNGCVLTRTRQEGRKATQFLP